MEKLVVFTQIIAHYNYKVLFKNFTKEGGIN